MTSNPAMVLVVVCAAIGGVEALRLVTSWLMSTLPPATVLPILPMVFRLGLAVFLAARTVGVMMDVQHQLFQTLETVRHIGFGLE